MSRRIKILCGVPSAECTGSRYMTDQQLARKAHADRSDAFLCHSRYLIKQGFERIGPREFRPPDGGPIRVLTKKSRFGGKLRGGKEGTRYQPEHGPGLVIG